MITYFQINFIFGGEYEKYCSEHYFCPHVDFCCVLYAVYVRASSSNHRRGGDSGTSYKPEDIPQTIPEELLAWYGIQTDKSKLPDGVQVDQKFVQDAESTIIAVAKTATTPKTNNISLVSTITLTDFPYNGYIFNSEGIVITYPATVADTSYTINAFTISADKIEVTITDADETAVVSVNETVGKLQDDATSSTSPVTVMVTADNKITSITNIPTTEDSITMDSWSGSYVVDNEKVSKPVSEGMTGAEDKPYRIETLDDIAHLQDMFDDANEVNIVLEKDMTLTSEWIMDNLITDGTFNSITIKADQNIVFDFNGKTLTYEGVSNVFNERFFKIDDGGELTINNGLDNSRTTGGIDITAVNVRGVFNNFGKLTINGGKFQTVADSSGTLVYNRETGLLDIKDGSFICTSYDSPVYNIGIATINDGYFYTNSNNTSNARKYCIITGGPNEAAQGGISLSGGNCVINYAKVYVADNPELGYEGSKAFYAVYVSGEETPGSVIINDGYFESDSAALWVANGNTGGDGGLMLDATAVVNGGTFKSNKKDFDVQVNYKIGSLTLTGGTFVHEKVHQEKAPTESEGVTLQDFVADGYTVELNAETNLYEVVKAN